MSDGRCIGHRVAGVRAADDAGQSLVEFALVLPLVLLLLIGILDLGRGFQAYVSLGNAVREAAREATVHGSAAAVTWGPAANDASVVTAVRGRLAGIPVADVTVTSSWPDGDNALGSVVVVTASHSFRPVAFEFLGGITIPLSASTRARIQH